jgi:hypothetical protein
LEPTSNACGVRLPTLIGFADADIRREKDGWHVVLRTSGVVHRIWLAGAPQSDVSYSLSLPLDDHFDLRAVAALRLWRSLIGRAPGDDPSSLTAQRRGRLIQALRALDGRNDGATYRDIAGSLFGAGRLPERAWKTHDLRGRTIRLVATGYQMMRGGYRKLLGMFRGER